MLLKLASFRNDWTIHSVAISRLAFFIPGEGIKATADAGAMPRAYAGEDRAKMYNNACDAVVEITDVAKRRSLEVGIREGGHFLIADMLHLDLTKFPAYTLDRRITSTSCGVNYWSRGVDLTYTPVVAGEAQQPVKCFFYHRDAYEEERTPFADKIEKVHAWMNKNVSGSMHSRLTENDVERLILKRAELIELLQGLE